MLHLWKNGFVSDNSGDGLRDNHQVFSQNFLKTFEEYVNHLRPEKNPHCVPQPIIQQRNSDKEKLQSQVLAQKRKVKNEGSNATEEGQFRSPERSETRPDLRKHKETASKGTLRSRTCSQRGSKLCWHNQENAILNEAYMI